MDVDIFEKIIQQAVPLTDQVCLHLMGDPLVHPKLKDFVQICDQYKMPIFLVTNAVLLKESNVDLLLHPAFRQLNFSLHSFFDNFPNNSTGRSGIYNMGRNVSFKLVIPISII